MLNPLDLQRVAADRAAAILVLCNKFTAAPGRGSLAVFVLILKCSDDVTLCVSNDVTDTETR